MVNTIRTIHNIMYEVGASKVEGTRTGTVPYRLYQSLSSLDLSVLPFAVTFFLLKDTDRKSVV